MNKTPFISYLRPEELEQVRAQVKAGNSLMKEELEKRLNKKSGKFYEQVKKAQSRYATKMLFQYEHFRGEIYDSYHFDDGIIDAAISNNNSIFVTTENFLEHDRGCVHVITEPRPELGVAYARKALQLVTGKIALLLPLLWMAQPEVKILFSETPIARVYIITKKLRYRKGPMAWYVFERTYEQPTFMVI